MSQLQTSPSRDNELPCAPTTAVPILALLTRDEGSLNTICKMSDSDFETIKRLQQERNAAAAAKKGSRGDASSQRESSTKQSLLENADSELYDRDGGDKFSGYHASLPMGDDDDDDMEDGDNTRRLVGQYTASSDMINEFARGEGVEEEDLLAGRGEKSGRITDRETDYQKRRFDRVLTPT